MKKGVKTTIVVSKHVDVDSLDLYSWVIAMKKDPVLLTVESRAERYSKGFGWVKTYPEFIEKLYELEERIDERLYEKSLAGEPEVVKLKCSKALADLLEEDGYTVRGKRGAYLVSNE